MCTRSQSRAAWARSGEEGAAALEYAIMAAAVAAMIVVVVGLVGGEVLALFESVPGF